MKKLLVLLLASLFIFAACSNGNSKPDEPEQTPASTSTETSTSSSTGGGSTGGSGGEEGNNQGGETIVTRTEVSGKIGKYGSPYEVGDIIFNDGSAIPYTTQLTLTDEQKASAIAVIFYKGNELNNGEDTKIRSLGVGFKHGTNLQWCRVYQYYDELDECFKLFVANAYYKEITTIQCTDGSVWNNELQCLIPKVNSGDKDGSDNLEQISEFLSAEDRGTTDDTGIPANYPAFYYAKNYKDSVTNITGTEYETGWYLPSYAELLKIYENGKSRFKLFDLNVVSNLCGGDTFDEETYYWSSSQFEPYEDNIRGYLCRFGGDWGGSCKDAPSNACAIREFN